MIALTNRFKIPIKFIIFNPTEKMEKSDNLQFWLDSLKSACPGIKIRSYFPPGKQVGSSCGEFTKHYYLSKLESIKDKKEFEDWKKRYQIEY